MHHRPGRAIPRIEHNPDFSLEMKLRSDLVHIRRNGIHFLHIACPGFEIVIHNQLVNILDGLAVQRARPANRFDSVVFGRVMASGDHDGAVGLEVNGRIIQHRRRHRSDVEHMATRGEQSFDQRIVNARSAEPAIGPSAIMRPLWRMRYVAKPRPSVATSASSNSSSAIPRMSYSRKIPGLSISSE